MNKTYRVRWMFSVHGHGEPGGNALKSRVMKGDDEMPISREVCRIVKCMNAVHALQSGNPRGLVYLESAIWR